MPKSIPSFLIDYENIVSAGVVLGGQDFNPRDTAVEVVLGVVSDAIGGVLVEL